MVPLLKPDRCPTCKFVDKQVEDGKPPQYFCRRQPPQMATLYTVIPGQQGMQPLVFGSIAQFPKVETDWTCGEYVRGFLKPSDAPTIDDIATQPINGGN
jgi:hypothetical protein